MGDLLQRVMPVVVGIEQRSLRFVLRGEQKYLGRHGCVEIRGSWQRCGRLISRYPIRISLLQREVEKQSSEPEFSATVVNAFVQHVREA